MMAEHSDDLDQLLDSALNEFENLNLSSSGQRNADTGRNKQENSTIETRVQGLGMSLPDLRTQKNGKQKGYSKESHVSVALDKLREQTMETVKGLESIAGSIPSGDSLGNDAMLEDWVKQFEELAGSQDMESIVDTMMQQLLSKEILHDPMKEIQTRYPKWLEDHKSTLSLEQYDRYSKQLGLIEDLNEVYESEPGNFNKIVELMQKMQECGQPPNDIVRELSPDFDISTLSQLSPEMLDSQQNCCIMKQSRVGLTEDLSENSNPFHLGHPMPAQETHVDFLPMSDAYNPSNSQRIHTKRFRSKVALRYLSNARSAYKYLKGKVLQGKF